METLTIADKLRLLELAKQDATLESVSEVYRTYVSLIKEDDKKNDGQG